VRSITTLLATLLSVLMVAAPVSTAACDLSCWLLAALPACHAGNPAHPGQGDSMAMPSGMDMSEMAMDSAKADNSKTNDRTPIVVSVHTMPNMEMPVDGIVQTAEFEFSWRHSVKGVSPCMHGACSQSSASASTSPSDANYSPGDRPQLGSQPSNLLSPVSRIEVRTSPPDISAVITLATALRI
jgi:hypothetical protein